MTAELNPFDDEGTVAKFATDHYDLVRGKVRTAMIDRQLALHLPDEPVRIVDVGGGSGQQSIPLAERGHHVTIADPSPSMLAKARARIAEADPSVAGRVDLVEASAETVVDVLGAGLFDAVLCHGVILYIPTEPTLETLVELAAPGGFISVVTCNSRALALRPALDGRWEEALRAFDSPDYRNELGIDARSEDPERVGALLTALGAPPIDWYGVRLFTDPIWSPATRTDDLELALQAEWEAATRDPYRQVSRLFHLVARLP
jgi:SAM-dependent methyltransferase